MTRHVEQEAGAREDAVVRGGMEPRRRRGGARRGVASAAAALWRSAWPLSFPFPFFRPKKKKTKEGEVKKNPYIRPVLRAIGNLRIARPTEPSTA